MTITKNEIYNDSSDKIATFRFTGKKKKVNYGYGEWATAYQFERKDKSPAVHAIVGTTMVWKPMTSIEYYMTKA